jgi:hypothetical protein
VRERPCPASDLASAAEHVKRGDVPWAPSAGTPRCSARPRLRTTKTGSLPAAASHAAQRYAAPPASRGVSASLRAHTRRSRRPASSNPRRASSLNRRIAAAAPHASSRLRICRSSAALHRRRCVVLLRCRVRKRRRKALLQQPVPARLVARRVGQLQKQRRRQLLRSAVHRSAPHGVRTAARTQPQRRHAHRRWARGSAAVPARLWGRSAKGRTAASSRYSNKCKSPALFRYYLCARAKSLHERQRSAPWRTARRVRPQRGARRRCWAHLSAPRVRSTRATARRARRRHGAGCGCALCAQFCCCLCGGRLTAARLVVRSVAPCVFGGQRAREDAALLQPPLPVPRHVQVARARWALPRPRMARG